MLLIRRQTLGRLAWIWSLGLLLFALWQSRGLEGHLRPALVYYRGPATAKVVAFACNVVWGEPYVLPIAEVFQRAHVRATFFLGGRFAERHPEIVRRLAALGMELANHGYAHRHVAELSLGANEAEIEKAQLAIERAGGRPAKLYAPAFGELNQTVEEAARHLGYRVVMWTIDTVDWRPWHTPAIIRARVLEKLTPGAIILIHPTDRTLEALPTILDDLRAKGYRAVSVGELLAAAAP